MCPDNVWFERSSGATVRRMARPTAQLRCPSCEVVGHYKPLGDRHPKSLEREYRCQSCGHKYKTEETVVEGDPDAFLLTPKSPVPARFDAAILETHLETHLKKLLTEEQRHRIASRTSSDFPRWLPSLQRMDVPKEYAAVVGTAPLLQAAAIRPVILHVFTREARSQSDPDARRRLQSAAAMYRLTEVGTTLQPFSSWLRSYFNLRLPAPTAGSRRAQEVWSPPVGKPTQPRVVVKNRITQDETIVEGEARQPRDRAERRSRDHVQFRRERLASTVAAAIGSEDHGQRVSSTQFADQIVDWVLWCCDGQPVVRSSQLAAYAAGALRRSAPIAYLRWATLGKELRPEELFDETSALITNPPPRLVFQAPASPGLNQPMGPFSRQHS